MPWHDACIGSHVSRHRDESQGTPSCFARLHAAFCSQPRWRRAAPMRPGRSGPSPSSRRLPRRHRRRRGAADRGTAAVRAQAEFHRGERLRRRRHGRARARRQGHARRLHADVDADLPAHHGEVRTERHVRREHDFKPISAVASAPFAITVDASFPGKTLADFIAHVKANPGKLTLRFGRRRQHDACRRGAGAQGRGPRHDPRAISRRRARLHRPARGPHRDGCRLAGRAQAVSGIRQAQAARGPRHQAVAVPAERAAGDRDAEGLPARRDLQRAARAPGHAAGGRRHAVARAGRGRQVAGVPAAVTNVGLAAAADARRTSSRRSLPPMPRVGTASCPASD